MSDKWLNVETIKHNSAKELFLSLLEIEAASCIFRGMGCSSRDLSPSIYRAPIIEDPKRRSANGIELFKEVRYLEEFIQGCDLSGLRVSGDNYLLRSFFVNHMLVNEDNIPVNLYRNSTQWPLGCKGMIELMAQAQHHGVPTRLLDWTSTSAVACYFAAMQLLNIFAENNYRLIEADKKFISIVVLEKNNAHFRGSEIVLNKFPGYTSKNIAAQGGLFSYIKGGDIKELDILSLIGVDRFLVRHILPVDKVSDLIEICTKVGVTSATMFPGYEGAAKHAKDIIINSNFQNYLNDSSDC